MEQFPSDAQVDLESFKLGQIFMIQTIVRTLTSELEKLTGKENE